MKFPLRRRIFMISSVFVSGRLGEKISDNLRYVEVDRPIPEKGKFVTDSFLVKSQSYESSPFIKEPKGAYICFKGRIENDLDHGLIIVMEIDEMYRFPEGTRRI